MTMDNNDNNNNVRSSRAAADTHNDFSSSFTAQQIDDLDLNKMMEADDPDLDRFMEQHLISPDDDDDVAAADHLENPSGVVPLDGSSSTTDIPNDDEDNDDAAERPSKKPLQQHPTADHIHNHNNSTMKTATELAQTLGLPTDDFPRNQLEADIAERAMEQQMKNLSLQEREQQRLDMHGIRVLQQKQQQTSMQQQSSMSPQELEQVDQMQQQLDHLIADNKEAYDLARRQNASYVDDLRIHFLRYTASSATSSSSQDRKEAIAHKAAQLMLAHFDTKRQIFHHDQILARPVRWDDLTEDEHQCLESAQWQVTPTKDAAGRTVFVFNQQFAHKTAESLVKCFWYVSMAALANDIELQKNGGVFVICNYTGKTDTLASLRKVQAVQTAVPIQLSAVHFCYNSPWIRPVAVGMRMFFYARHHSSRFTLNTHYHKDPQEINFKLQTFGIPTHTWVPTWHAQWLRMQREREGGMSIVVEQQQQHQSDNPNGSHQHMNNNNNNTPTDSSGICVPRQFDVLFGKSKFAREHTGTMRCQFLVESHRDEYEKASRREKTTVANKIMALVRESQGRFLKADAKGIWREVEEKVAREKISHFFRQMRFNDKNNKNGNNKEKGEQQNKRERQ